MCFSLLNIHEAPRLSALIFYELYWKKVPWLSTKCVSKQCFNLFTVQHCRYDVESFSGSNYVLMKLRVKNIVEIDYGKYSCYAENSQGNGESYVTLSRKYIIVYVSMIKTRIAHFVLLRQTRSPLKVQLIVDPDWL